MGVAQRSRSGDGARGAARVGSAAAADGGGGDPVSRAGAGGQKEVHPAVLLLAKVQALRSRRARDRRDRGQGGGGLAEPRPDERRRRSLASRGLVLRRGLRALPCPARQQGLREVPQRGPRVPRRRDGQPRGHPERGPQEIRSEPPQRRRSRESQEGRPLRSITIYILTPSNY